VTVNPEKLHFLDETSFRTDMTRLRGWCASDRRLVEKVPCKRWETVTLVHTINLFGSTAAMVCKGAIDNAGFETYCSKFLGPALDPSSIVVLDNLRQHKSAEAIKSIEAVGGRMAFLPPYSPDLNPIENLFAKIKQVVRKIKPRNFEDLIDAIAEAINSITQRNIQNAFEHAGYLLDI